ncbi:unnamed protein product [Lasius platythorax]|uniref:Uncharacterized protein n=1 Tax=Lasius platythorax TaxID=488582 RepID=A0AAV2P2I0_9HYME
MRRNTLNTRSRVKNNWPPEALPEIPDVSRRGRPPWPSRSGTRVDRYSAKSTISETRDETGPPADAGYMTRGRKSIITGTKTFSRDEWLEGKAALTNWADLTGARSNNNTE